MDSTRGSPPQNPPDASLVSYWDEVLGPLIETVSAKRLVEIGADTGAMTLKLLEYARNNDCVVESIDPSPSFDVEKVEAAFPGLLRFHRNLSLEVLPELEFADVILIDGDHNWYTVLHELTIVEHRALSEGLTPPLIALHDIDWPYGRRDLYYDPKTLPAGAVRPFEYRGMEPDRDELVDGGLNHGLANATLPEDSHSGIRGAIEDFLTHSDIAWTLFEIHGHHGLGILAPNACLDSNPAVREVLERTGSPDFLRQRVTILERARIDADVKASKTEQRAQMAIEQAKEHARAAIRIAGQGAQQTTAGARRQLGIASSSREPIASRAYVLEGDDVAITSQHKVHVRPAGMAMLDSNSHFTEPYEIRSPHRISIGKNVWFAGGALLSVVEHNMGSDYDSYLTIGDDCLFEADLLLHCASRIEIGANVIVAKRVYIGDSFRDYDNPGSLVKDLSIAEPKPIRIRAGAFLGTGCAILPGVTIGKRAIISAGAVVTRSVPDTSVVFGNPARVVRSWDSEKEEWRVGR